MLTPDFDRGFGENASEVKYRVLGRLLNSAGYKAVAGSGMAAKGRTPLEIAGVGQNVADFVIEQSSARQCGRLPGTGISVSREVRLTESRPEYIVSLPADLELEVINQLTTETSRGAADVKAASESEIP